MGPERVPRDSVLARARGCENVLVVTGELGGNTVYSGAGAGANPTAVAVISDLVAIAASRSGAAAAFPGGASLRHEAPPAHASRPTAASVTAPKGLETHA